MSYAHRRRAAAFLLLLAFAGEAPAWAQSRSVEVPSYRQLGAAETMSAPGNNGTDYSAHAPSLSGLSLLATIPAATTGSPRLGYFIEAECAAGLTVVFDDQAGSMTPTLIVLLGAAADGGQGGALDMVGMPHSGRIRIYSSSAACQMAARIW